MSLTVRVIGTPAPQGSKRGFVGKSGRVQLVESSAAVRPWRQDVAAAAEQRVTELQWVPPKQVSVTVTFYLVRPRSAPKSRTLPNVKPDLDKLVRSTLDALTTAGVFTDDATVVELTARKAYALPGEALGAQITVCEVA